MAVMNIVFAVILAAVGVYLYFFVKGIVAELKLCADKLGTKIIIGVVAVCMVLTCTSIWSVGTIVIMHMVVIGLITQLINFIIKKASGIKYHNFNIWKKIYGLRVIPIVITAVFLIYGYFNMMNVVGTDYTVTTSKNIREEGYRVALIADLHFGVSIDTEELKRVCEKVSKENIDIVVLCGDIVDENTEATEMEEAFASLGAIESNYGVYFVYGNHDRQPYRDDKKYTEEQLENAITSSGITILSDEIYTINDELSIVGREDASFTKDSNRKSLEALLETVDMEDYILVLDHQPTDYDVNADLGSDLLLSGHTHAGQIWPANIFLSVVKFDDAVYGYTSIDDFNAIVTSGIAGWGYPVKTSAPAEYVVIDIIPD